jgi:uncharacterized protein (UPF0297 family)
MPTTFASARTTLAPYVDNGVNSTDTTRIDSRINEAQRRLIDHFNFLCRREELERAALVYAASPTNLILDNLDATKVLILGLWREENNELEMAASLEKRALDMVERDLMQEVETDRRVAYQLLERKGYNTLGGLVGRLGLEVVPRYRIAPDRLRSYIRAAYRMAVDHHNYVVRREALSLPAITANTLPTDDSTLAISTEIIREIVISQMAQDNA